MIFIQVLSKFSKPCNHSIFLWAAVRRIGQWGQVFVVKERVILFYCDFLREKYVNEVPLIPLLQGEKGSVSNHFSEC